MYVGVAYDVRRRMAEHRLSHAWWVEHVAALEVEWYPSREVALEVERRALQAEQPRHNFLRSDFSRVRWHGPAQLLRAERIDNSREPVRRRAWLGKR